jgi:hypothetical protein
MRFGTLFFASYLKAKDQRPKAVLDVGGQDVNGTLRSAAPESWRFVSADMTSGKGVDVVLDDPYKLPFSDGEFDAVISTSCFEHDACFWLSFLEMLRVTNVGGYVYLNAPSGGLVHRYPIDAWRFYPDASVALVDWARRSGMEATLCESFVGDAAADGWRDFVAIFRRGKFSDAGAIPIHASVACSNVHAIGSEDVVKFRADLMAATTPLHGNPPRRQLQLEVSTNLLAKRGRVAPLPTAVPCRNANSGAMSEPASEILHRLATSDRPAIGVGVVAAAAGARVHGLALLIIALPEAVPLPLPSASLVLAWPLLVIAGHLAVFGERRTLPGWLSRRTIPRSVLSAVDAYGGPLLKRMERLSRPRWGALARQQRLAGFVAFYLALILLLPLPFFNVPPAISIVALGLGLIQHDGIATAIGVAGAILITGFLAGLIVAGALVLGPR